MSHLIEDLLSARQQLNKAIDNHEQWYKQVSRVMICNLQPDQRDMLDNAHRNCHFGQWYYGEIPDILRHHETFLAMEPAHKNMHQCATKLLHATCSNDRDLTREFDDFTSALDRFRLQLYTLIREIEVLIQNRDPLTGAENRVNMLTAMREMLGMIKRGIQTCTIALMDLDKFKDINDTYGHVTGDQVLTSTVDYLRQHLRPYDRMFRYGGEEFLIILPGITDQTGNVIVERIRKGLENIPVANDGNKPIFITASFGLAVLDPEIHIEDSIDRADKALYEAKSSGRNCTRIWSLSTYE